MSTTYQIGSLCEDCLQHGSQNFLKSFYINLEEQIIKCESSTCMFPYLRKPVICDLSNSKPSDSTTFLDEFVVQSLEKIENMNTTTMATTTTATTTIKSGNQTSPSKLELDNTDMYDFSSIFMTSPIKTKSKEMVSMTIPPMVREETNLTQSNVINNLPKNENSRLRISIDTNKNQVAPPPKTRISRCLSNVRSTSKTTNAKKSKAKIEKSEPVFVIEPQSGKSMRPLDLIKRYVKNK